MFKVGETYKILMQDNGGNGPTTYFACKIVSVQMPLIKIAQGDDERIINTNSIGFISAEKQ